MALESQQSIIAHHAAAVVSDLDELLAAGFNLNPDAGCARIERIFEQLLGHRSRTLHHFAGGDLVGNAFGKNVDSAHEGLRGVSVADDGLRKQSTNRRIPAKPIGSN